MQKISEDILNDLEGETTKNSDSNNRYKIVFFVKQGLDSFLNDIIDGLSNEYETKKVIVTEYKQIDEGMIWADISWFEWCDELIIYGSKLELAKEKKIICRLHSYEAFTDYINNVNWDNVDSLILIGEHIKDLIVENFNINEEIISVIPNGIDEKKWTFKEREKGFYIAYVGYINYKKGPMLLLHTFKAIYDRDHRYKLYIAGVFQDNRDVLYYNQMVREFGLENNVIYEGWQNDLDKWLEDKNYILCTSVLESQNVSVMQAMYKGIKPIIHNFVGAKTIYREEYVWNKIDDAVNMICGDEYDSQEYKKIIEEKYSLRQQINKMSNLLNIIISSKVGIKNTIKWVSEVLKGTAEFHNIENLTLVIPTFNRASILKDDLEKGFKLGNQNKIILDDASNNINAEILNSLPHKKNRFGIEKIIYNKDNVGVAGTVNILIKNIETKFTMILGDDDIILCKNYNAFKSNIQKFSSECNGIISRYIINLNEYGELYLGYDRKMFDNLKYSDILKYIFITGEICLLNNGAIYRTKDLKSALVDEMFLVSDDYVMLSRLSANNLNKAIKVSEDYIYIRRVSNNTLSKQIDKNKLSLHLISLMVSGYYCLVNKLISVEELKATLRKRGELIERIYSYGSEFVELLISYIEKKISIEGFILAMKKDNILNSLSIESFPREFISIKELCE